MKGPPVPDWQLLGGDSDHTSVPLQPLGSAQCWLRVNAYYAEAEKKKGKKGGREGGREREMEGEGHLSSEFRAKHSLICKLGTPHSRARVIQTAPHTDVSGNHFLPPYSGVVTTMSSPVTPLIFHLLEKGNSRILRLPHPKLTANQVCW